LKDKISFKFGVLALSLVLIACSGGSADAGCPEIDGREINVVATTPMIGEFVNQIGGDSINLTVLMPLEANPHTYEPAPQDAGTIADADLVFYTGLMYEPAPLIELLENSVCGSEALAEVGESVFPIEFKEGGHDDHHDDHGEKGHDDHDEEGHDDHDEEGHDDHDEEGHDDHDEEGHDDHSGHEGHGHGAYDPHFWFDPNRVAYAAEFIESKLIERDPSNTASYQAAGDAYGNVLNSLTGQVSQLIASIPSQNRKLITTHESLGYLEAKFGLEVLSTIIPDLDSSNEISPSQLVGVIDVIEDNNIKVIFIEAEAPSVYSETIVAETGIKAVEGLWVETLRPGQTYPEFLITAVELIVENLTNTD
jgi:zinc/manganese transport system substrate-binding protein